ncbi:CHAT domain-containing protein [Novosphingobium sediminis]|uniref:CHAT domain-containing protein n=1 Tax=Novosphingobium sediminis TaxID=707214 RepID=A0A512AFK2_9SPHN|nr:CHAT domain-containing protein [Novosphingobium sediminis]GEN98485.1 CHAT domain-containing protein [Novosphingobium sediminis]
MKRAIGLFLSLAALGSGFAPADPAARPVPLSVRSSFRLGNAGVVCSAQVAPRDPRLSGMFDRSYTLSCRDAAGPVGTLVALRHAFPIDVAPMAGIPAAAGQERACGAAGHVEIDGLGQADAMLCRDPASGLDYRRYALVRGNTSYFVEGLAAYDAALRLALASVVLNRQVPGEIKVASTEVTDAAAFARLQAGLLDPLGVRGEGYLRNNGSSFAESAAFFEVLAEKARSEKGEQADVAEALANQALQQSNLGNFDTAARLFGESERAQLAGDGLSQRLLRNYRALDQLNQRNPDGAVAELAKSVDPVDAIFNSAKLADGEINLPLSEAINRENSATRRMGAPDPSLTRAEKAEILDGQALAIGATAARIAGRNEEAAAGFAKARERLAMVRGGRVASIVWLSAEIDIEMARIAGAAGRKNEAEAGFDRAIAELEAAYPASPAVLSAKARKAAFLLAAGDRAAAAKLFAAVVDESAAIADSGTTLRDLLAPYFSLLAGEGSDGAASAVAAFAAAQVLERPGVAQTQAILARQLTEGNDAAAALFRLSLARSRDIVRTEGEVARLGALPSPTASESAELTAQQEALTALRREQTEILAKLSAYPRYTSLAPKRVTLPEMQAALKAGEAYYKLVAVGQDIYGLYATQSAARLYAVPLSRADLARTVQKIRNSIVTIENGKVVNRPFDLDSSRALYKALFGPIDAELAGVRHLVFEPDAAMLQLPPAVLVTADAGIAAYKARTVDIDADAFDFTGIAWFGRDRSISIAVSPRAFLDLRGLAPSGARRPYLGLGNNTVPQQRPVTAVADSCDWPLAVWQRPVKADELLFAARTLGGTSVVKTGNSFTDTGLLADPSLDQYRVLHFATHGLVSAPRKDCPARPALVTSFGAKGSDGLLSFREIFDLKLDADLVILSACDTAGMATVAASREAGVTTGGNYALDGLVRAFTGAGARAVIASHWPVPDEFNATRRLIGGLIAGKPGESVGTALAGAEAALMDDPQTSHPFYWAAFVVVGDAAKPAIVGSPAR